MATAQRIRDPIHNLIGFEASEFERVIWEVIQTRPFQRLRRVKQLGFSDYVYPGATHSRLAHSIGVFHTARQLMEIVKANVDEVDWSPSKANASLAAALVHDVGHGPFSHAFEAVGDRLSLNLANHEVVSDILIRDSEISEPLRKISSGFHDDVADIIKAKGPRNVYDAVVSSQFDADRLDYMRRDRIMAGSSHGVIDYDWLRSSLGVDSISIGVDSEKVSELKTFVISRKGTFAAEAYVLGLFQLYPTIYLHKTTRGVEKLFVELLVKVFETVRSGKLSNIGLPKGHPLVQFAKNPSNVEAALRLDDAVVYGALSQLCDASDKLISELASRIRDRKLFRCFDIREAVKSRMLSGVKISTTNTSFTDFDLDKAVNKVSLIVLDKLEAWKSTEKKSLVLLDKTSRSPYKKLEESKGPLNQIMVRDYDGSLVDLSEFSPVVRGILPFEVARCYVDPSDLDTFKHIENVIDLELQHGL